MLEYAKVQDWDGLTRIGTQRFVLIQKAIEHRDAVPTTEQSQISGIIREIEQESAGNIERVQCWQEHVKFCYASINQPVRPNHHDPRRRRQPPASFLRCSASSGSANTRNQRQAGRTGSRPEGIAEIQAMLPNGTYRAIINQRNVTLALPFSAKTGDSLRNSRSPNPTENLHWPSSRSKTVAEKPLPNRSPPHTEQNGTTHQQPVFGDTGNQRPVNRLAAQCQSTYRRGPA